MKKWIALIILFVITCSIIPPPLAEASANPLVAVHSKKHNLSMMLPKKELSRIKIVEDRNSWNFYFKETPSKTGTLLVSIVKGYRAEAEDEIEIPIVYGDKESNTVKAVTVTNSLYSGAMNREYERVFDVILKHFVTLELSTSRYVYTVPWGKTTYKKGQLGKITFSKQSDYYAADKSSKLVKKGTFTKGTEKPVFKPVKAYKGYLYIGGGYYLSQKAGKFSKPPASFVSMASNEQLKTYQMKWTNRTNSKDSYYQMADIKYLGGSSIDLTISGVIFHRSDQWDTREESLSKARVLIDSNGVGTFKYTSGFTGTSGIGYIYLRNHRVMVYLLPDDSFAAINIGINSFHKRWTD